MLLCFLSVRDFNYCLGLLLPNNSVFFYGTLSFQTPAGRRFVLLLLALKIIYNKHVKCMLRFRKVVFPTSSGFHYPIYFSAFCRVCNKKAADLQTPINKRNKNLRQNFYIKIGTNKLGERCAIGVCSPKQDESVIYGIINLFLCLSQIASNFVFD